MYPTQTRSSVAGAASAASWLASHAAPGRAPSAAGAGAAAGAGDAGAAAAASGSTVTVLNANSFGR